MADGINSSRLQEIAEELERLHDRCERQLLTVVEVSTAVRNIDTDLRGLLPPGSDSYRLLDRGLRQSTDYWRVTISGYVERHDCANVARRLAIVREILREIEPDFLRAEHAPPHQFYFQPGEVYRSRQELFHLLSRATESVVIADPYLDPLVFSFLEPLDQALKVRLLSGRATTLFASQLHALAGSGRVIEARTNDLNHDRFIILDAREAWQLGASINGLGKKACMINKIGEADRARVTRDFESWWASASPL